MPFGSAQDEVLRCALAEETVQCFGRDDVGPSLIGDTCDLKLREDDGFSRTLFSACGGVRIGKEVIGLAQELGDDTGTCLLDFDFRREGAVSEVEGDLFHGFDLGCRPAARLGLGEVEAGDLEAIEEQARAAWIDVVGGDAAEDFADGVLDGAAVFGQRDLEGGTTAAAQARVFDRLAGGVVVVTKFLLAEAGAAAAASIGEDVAALIAFPGLECCGLHGGTPLPIKSAQSIQKKGLSPDFPGLRPFVFMVKCKSPADDRASLSLHLMLTGVSRT